MNAPNQSLSVSAVEAEAALFELAQRKAAIYAKSTLVPQQYQNNIGNVMIAENMAIRMGADTLMVMQNLYIVYGNPGWSAQFLIACFNQCGRFSAIKYRFTGERGKESWGCIAYATELSTGEVVEGAEITIAMAKAEGWSTKAGSKWKTMPEQMLMYRSATFMIRTTAPEIGMGLQTREELDDHIIDVQATPRISSLDELTDKITGDAASGEASEEPKSETVATDSKPLPEIEIIDNALAAIESAADAAVVADQVGIAEQAIDPLKLPAARKKEILRQINEAAKAKHGKLSK